MTPEGHDVTQKNKDGNVIPYPDQALFLALRGAGQGAVMQGLWSYPGAVDVDAIRRVHHNLSRSLLGRRLEPSALPFGRHRWVAQPADEANFDVATTPRPRAEFIDWADDQVDRPLDPQWGPAWRLSVQPFDDGSTAVSFVISHCIADGSGSIMSITAAINDVGREMGYPAAGSRTRFQAIREDLGQLRRDLPEIARTVAAGAKVALRRRHDIARPVPPVASGAGSEQLVRIPSATMILDAAEWDARAESLGGNSFSLVAGFTGKLAANLGRVRASDQMATLMIPVNERLDLEDTGGNVVSLATLSFDPGKVSTDLTQARTAIREGLKKAREQPDEMMELVPLIPFLPKRAFARMVDVTFGFSADLPSSCSNLGQLPPDFLRLDGSPADYVIFRGLDRHVTKASLERRGGLLTITSGRMDGKILLTAMSYQPGGDNTQTGLRAVIRQTLDDFGVTGAVV